MKKTTELKAKFEKVFSNKANHNRLIKIDGDEYIYISCRNEIRKFVVSGSTTNMILIGCLAFGNFVWCC